MRVEARITVYGVNLDELIANAFVELNRLFKGYDWNIIEVDIVPQLQHVGRRPSTETWQAEVTAGVNDEPDPGEIPLGRA